MKRPKTKEHVGLWAPERRKDINLLQTVYGHFVLLCVFVGELLSATDQVRVLGRFMWDLFTINKPRVFVCVHGRDGALVWLIDVFLIVCGQKNGALWPRGREYITTRCKKELLIIGFGSFLVEYHQICTENCNTGQI